MLASDHVSNKALKAKGEIGTLFKCAGAAHLTSKRSKETGGGVDWHASIDSGLGPTYYSEVKGPFWRYTPDETEDTTAGGKRSRPDADGIAYCRTYYTALSLSRMKLSIYLTHSLANMA